jgi:hypothetical protein
MVPSGNFGRISPFAAIPLAWVFFLKAEPPRRVLAPALVVRAVLPFNRFLALLLLARLLPGPAVHLLLQTELVKHGLLGSPKVLVLAEHFVIGLAIFHDCL